MSAAVCAVIFCDVTDCHVKGVLATADYQDAYAQARSVGWDVDERGQARCNRHKEHGGEARGR